MNGNNPEILLSSNSTTMGIKWPNDISVDITSSINSPSGNWTSEPTVYWCDAHHDYIAKADADFKNLEIIYKPKEHSHIFSMALFEDYVYFSDWADKSVKRIAKNRV